jgi:heme/copper-type cytochrome/quinol oxidase subunit 2
MRGHGMRLTRRHTLAAGIIGLFLAALLVPVLGTAAAASDGPAPQNRNFTVSTVPLLVHEQTGTFGFLQQDFAPGGVLDGKEIYGFNPSQLTVQKYDRVHVTIVNPSDDPHTFTVPELGVNVVVDGQSANGVSFVASRAGAFTLVCTVTEHSPFMNGQLVVLPRVLE